MSTDGNPKPIFVTLKGKARVVDVPRVGKMRVTKHKSGGHTSIELELVEPENIDAALRFGVSCQCKAAG